MKILKINNKGILIFDSVRFITSNLTQRFSKELIDKLNDYRIIITHGVIGELINLIENKTYDLDKSKIHLLINNIETCKLFNLNGYNTYDISEYIFTDDDKYNIIEKEKIFDCIFPGRLSKTNGLFSKEYENKINLLYKSEKYPYPSHSMPELYNQAKVGLMTTESEGSCLSVGEMLCCGVPVVSVKINNTVNEEVFYPTNKSRYQGTYNIVLPNTLGGRELWLDSNNSIYCERQDSEIDKAITSLKNLNLSKEIIRKDFISKLNQHRLKFLFLLNSLLKDLDISFSEVEMNNFINLPYGNSSITSKGWKDAVSHFKSSYIL